MRRLIFSLRFALWLPFRLLRSRVTLVLMTGVVAIVIHQHPRPRDLPFDVPVMVLAVIIIHRAAYWMAETLAPGAPPARRVQPARRAVTQPAATTRGGSPSEQDVLPRLAAPLQRFLAAERAARKPAE